MSGGGRRTVPSLLAKKIRHLLSTSHEPLVEVRRSAVIGAGNGVFATTAVQKDEAVALYPGIYTPSHPSSGFFHSMPGGDDFMVSSEVGLYLANVTSPTGKPMEDCAYILNLQGVGGYLDGEALHRYCDGIESFNTNTSACGHLVNHSAVLSNVSFESFRWSDVFGAEPKNQTGLPAVLYHKIPNERRQDGTPWYHDGERVVHFLSREEVAVDPHGIGGAVFTATKNIEDGEELFLNYQLSHPLPNWAKGWYSDSN